MNSNNSLHVILGTGPVALATMRQLCDQGARVRMVNRRGTAKGVPEGVEVVKADLYDAQEVRRVTQGAAVVYSAAQPAYTEWTTKFLPLQTAIIDGVAYNKAKLVVMENMYVYGKPEGKPLTENTPFNAHTRKGAVRVQMAQQVAQAHTSGKLRTAQVRASDFYGPFVLESLLGERELYPMLAGKGSSGYGNIDVPHSYTYIDDIGRAMVTVAARDEALGQAWHVPNAPAITQRQMLGMFFEALGMKPKISVINRPMMMLAGLFIPGARETVEMMYEFEQPFVVDHSKYARAFGEHFTPYRETVPQTLAWYKANPHE